MHDSANNSIKVLVQKRDIDSLLDILTNDTNPLRCLDAAKALAQLGNERGKDYLIAALEIPDLEVKSTAKMYLAELNRPKKAKDFQAHQESSIPSIDPDERPSLNARYPYLTGYVGFIALYLLLTVLVSFVPLPTILRYTIVVVIGFYIFKYVVQKNILPFK